MKCFYHLSDLDGHCSGAIVKYKYPHCEMIPFNYGMEFPWDTISKGEAIVLTDISLEPFSDMEKLNDMCALAWIDHHKTPIDEYVARGHDWRGLRRIGVGACQLTWEYFFGSNVPEAVSLLSKYDVWDHQGADTVPFNYGLRLYDTHPEGNMHLWKQLFQPQASLRQYINDGEKIQKYINQDYAKSCKELAFDVEFDGLKCLAANRQFCGSKLFEHAQNIDSYDAVISFALTPAHEWLVSMYSIKKDVDVSATAKKYGGGGHSGAAGFRCKKLPFISCEE